MFKKTKISAIVVFLLLVSLMILSWSLYKNYFSYPETFNNIFDKIYTVSEVKNLSNNQKRQLLGKKIRLKAYIVDAVKGVGCEDYVILTDYQYVDLYKKQYQNDLSMSERLKIVRIPLLKAKVKVPYGDSNFYPTVYAVYRGHLADAKLVRQCPKLKNSFVIEGKEKEIIPRRSFPYQEKVLDTGCLIINGKLLRPPLKLVLENNRISVNGIAYEPLETAHYQNITVETAELRKNHFQNLVNSLKKKRLIIVGGDRYEVWQHCNKNVLKEIQKTIYNSSLSREEKIKKLEQILNSPGIKEMAKDILDNWNLSPTAFYHCPTEKEMYRGNHLDCQPPFDQKEYCQPEYRRWIKQNCSPIIFID